MMQLELDYASRETSEKTLMTERHMKELEDFRNEVENSKREMLDIQVNTHREREGEGPVQVYKTLKKGG